MISSARRTIVWLWSRFEEADTRLPLRCGYFAIVSMICALVLWSAVMPLAESIIAPGTIGVSAQRRTIAHVDGGKVAALHIKEGDHVDAEQPLITLDGSQARSELEVLRYQHYARLAKIDRLNAERDGVDVIPFRDDLRLEAAANPQLAQLLQSESRQFASRREAIAAKDEFLAEQGRKATEQGRHFRLQLESMDRQLATVQKQIDNAADLYAKGFGTKSNVIAFQRELEQLTTQRLQIDAKVNELDGIVDDSVLNRRINQTEIADNIERDLIDAQQEVAELEEMIDAVRRRLDNLVVKSSVEGVVVALRVTSANDVIKPAAPILDILPLDSSFLVEAHVSPNEIDGIVTGLPVDVRFPSFATMKIPAIGGRIARVSADVLDDDRQQKQYYKILVSLDNLSELERQGIDVIPGMPTEVIIRKRDRSLFEYVFAPLTNHLAKAIVE